MFLCSPYSTSDFWNVNTLLYRLPTKRLIQGLNRHAGKVRLDRLPPGTKLLPGTDAGINFGPPTIFDTLSTFLFTFTRRQYSGTLYSTLANDASVWERFLRDTSNYHKHKT
jgi:hypothetical protein